MEQALADLWYGFGVALQPANLMWVVIGVVLGNLIGVLPGMGAMTTISMLLPLTYVIPAVPAILMLAGIFYGSMYGGAICAILLNLPSHPPHAVTCIDGYPMTLNGRGGAALGITMMASFFAASVGIALMVFVSPLLEAVAFKFGPTEISAVMLLGLLAGSTMARGSPLKGIAMTLFGLFLGAIGTDVNTGVQRYTFGLQDLADGVDLAALSLGLFGVADFLLTVNRREVATTTTRVTMRQMMPTRRELKAAILPMLRGTGVGAIFGAMPGTGPTITTFVAYALERKIAKTPERFGKGAIEGVAAPEAAAHSKTQIDFIPTMSLGIPGDPVMALLLGALIIKGINTGPQLITEHPDVFWGLVASFWIGNLLLIVLNVPLIGIWVRLLRLPYRFLFPSALFFIAVGVYSTHNNVFDILLVAAFGCVGAIFLMLDFPVAPVVLGFVLGPMLEENFRRAMVLSRGDLMIYLQRPLSAAFIVVSAALILLQIYGYLRLPPSSRPVRASH
ncbi:tripartite tricarboxylate transporter permease [Bradyrhizobium sp. STM 3562]|uniref:tripartite tricarboxylate transporter permease n=1 Tax=Bradyrhizobium sp. STM 3562 TaxID=578924 RepID=UPI0038901C88